MKLLTEYASNIYSQYGEDGIIAEICRRIGLETGVCVEFGASEGLACSNTANLWRNGWEAILIEANLSLMALLNSNTEGYNCTTKYETVTPSTVDAAIGRKDVDLISIDIDGDDYHVFCSMWVRTKILLVEYNRTIPPHLDLVPELGSQLGIGSLTLKTAAEQRGYTLLGLTEGNCIFVDTSYAHLFDDIEKDLAVLQPPESFMYLATDFTGSVLPLGDNPPWGLVWPPSNTEFRPNQDHLLGIHPASDIERLIRGIEYLDARAFQIDELKTAAMQIALDMRGGYNVELRDRIEKELGIINGVRPDA